MSRDGPPSNVATGTATGSTSAPSAPRNLAVQSGTGYIVLNWDAPTSSGTPAFTAYSIFRVHQLRVIRDHPLGIGRGRYPDLQ